MKNINLLKSLKVAMAVAITVVIPSLASATILATNTFEDNTVGVLSGQGGGTGWTGNWTAPGGVTRADVVNTTGNSLTYFPPNGLPVDGGTRALEVALTGAAASQLAGVRNLATPLATNFYVGYLVRYVGAGTWAANNNTFTLHLGTNSSSAASLNFGLRGDGATTANEFVVRYNTGAADPRVAIGGQLTNNTTYYLVVKMEWNGTAAYTNALMWLNPTATDDVDTPTGDGQLAFSCGPITHIFFRQAVLDADDILRADEVKFGTTWSDLVQMPPPIPMVRVATLPTALGVDVPAQSLTAGNSITVYANAYDDDTNFLYNTYASWSVENVTPGVVAGDLVPAANGKSATFTGHAAGSCTIRASANATNTYESGTITVTTGAAAVVRVETQADGNGTLVPAQSLAPGNTIQVFSIVRDVAGNFLSNGPAIWSLPTKTSAVVDGDLVPSGGNLDATFTAALSGTATIRATVSGLALVDSGLLTVSRAITWVGGGANPWDFTTTNWTADSGVNLTNFLNSDDVIFDGVGSQSPSVNLTTTLLPHSVNVTGGAYTFAGAGGISGIASLTNSSGGLLTLLTTNTYSGSTVVSLGSTLQLGNGTAASGSFGTGPVRIETGGTSPIFNRTDAASAPYVVSNTISGPANFLMEFKSGAVKFAGVGDNSQARAVVRSGATLILARTSNKDLGAGTFAVSGPVLDIELGGKVICGGPGTSADHIDSGGNTAQGLRYVTFNGTFDLNSNEGLGGITDTSSGTIDNTSTNAAILTVGTGINDSSSATFAGTIQNTGTGNLGITQTGTNTWILGSANTYRGDTRVTGGGVLRLGNVNSMQNSTLDYQTGDTGNLSFGSLTSVTFGGLKNAKGLGLTNDSGAAVALTIGGNNQANTYSGVLSQGGSLIKAGTNSQILSGTNTYAGTTTVSDGTLLVNGRLNGVGAVSVGASGTLGGTGVIAGTVGVSGGTLRPGNSGIGRLTVSSTATLAGNTVMEINRTTSTNDQLAATAIVLGGTLNVTNLSGILQAGNTFALFTGALSGSITTNAMPVLWPGLSWDVSALNTAGTIAVIGTRIPPQITSVSLSGGSLTVSGNGGFAGATYYLTSSTNIVIPRNTWTRVATNTFALDGGFTNSLPVDLAIPQNYFGLDVP